MRISITLYSVPTIGSFIAQCQANRFHCIVKCRCTVKKEILTHKFHCTGGPWIFSQNEYVVKNDEKATDDI